MPYIKEDKKKGIKEEYVPDWGKDISENELSKSKIPGLTSEIYKDGINFETSSGGGGVKTLTFTRLASVGTGTQSFTGFGFTPTYYKIEAYRYGDVTGVGTLLLCESIGHYNDSYNLKRRPNGSSQIEIATTSSIISVDYRNAPGSSSSNNTVATHSAFVSDGIELNFTASAEDIVMTITAYE